MTKTNSTCGALGHQINGVCPNCGQEQVSAILSQRRIENEPRIRPAEDWRWHLQCVEREMEMLGSAGIVEVAIRNPSVAEYMRHWEERATKAEAEVARLQKQEECPRCGALILIEGSSPEPNADEQQPTAQPAPHSDR